MTGVRLHPPLLGPSCVSADGRVLAAQRPRTAAHLLIVQHGRTRFILCRAILRGLSLAMTSPRSPTNNDDQQWIVLCLSSP